MRFYKRIGMRFSLEKGGRFICNLFKLNDLMVEARGVEPLSEPSFMKASPCSVNHLVSANVCDSQHPLRPASC